MQQTITKCRSANPVAYMEAGNHASFPCRLCIDQSKIEEGRSRSAGVQSTTSHNSGEQDTASGRQTQEVSSRARSLIVKSGETAGGLHKNRGSNTGMLVPSGNIPESLYSPSVVSFWSCTDSDWMLLNTTEN